MELQDLFQNIESHRFSALVNVANNFRTFVRAFASVPEVQQLTQAMQSPEVRAQIYERALELAREEGQEGQEHPGDAALATYLWLLSTMDENLAKVAAAEIGADR